MTNPETGVATVGPAMTPAVDRALDGFPVDAYNRVIPTETIRIQSDFFVPVVQVVRLTEAGKDLYAGSDVPSGHLAPTALALSKFATAAAVTFYGERRLDDGSNPDVIGVTVSASMMLPTGQTISRPGTKWIDIKTHFGPTTSAAEIAKFRKHFYAHVATRAYNRAIRGLLSLRSSYPKIDLAKPFAVVSYALNMNHPVVQQRMLDNLAPAIAQIYGPEATRELGSGDVARLPESVEAPEDDPAPAVAGEPGWMAGIAGEPEPRQKHPAALSFADGIRDAAEASGLNGPAQQPALVKLGEAFVDIDRKLVKTGIALLFGPEAVAAPSAAQAQAILTAHDNLNGGFAEAWTAMVEGAA